MGQRSLLLHIHDHIVRATARILLSGRGFCRLCNAHILVYAAAYYYYPDRAGFSI